MKKVNLILYLVLRTQNSLNHRFPLVSKFLLVENQAWYDFFAVLVHNFLQTDCKNIWFWGIVYPKDFFQGALYFGWLPTSDIKCSNKYHCLILFGKFFWPKFEIKIWEINRLSVLSILLLMWIHQEVNNLLLVIILEVSIIKSY